MDAYVLADPAAHIPPTRLFRAATSVTMLGASDVLAAVHEKSERIVGFVLSSEASQTNSLNLWRRLLACHEGLGFRVPPAQSKRLFRLSFTSCSGKLLEDLRLIGGFRAWDTQYSLGPEAGGWRGRLESPYPLIMGCRR